MKALKTLLVLTFTFFFLVSCAPTLIIPTGVVPTPQLPNSNLIAEQSATPTAIPNADDEFPLEQVNGIQTLCVTTSGNLADSTFANMKEQLGKHNVQVVMGESNCDAQLMVNLEFDPISDMYENTGGTGMSNCYTGSQASAQFSLLLPQIEPITLSFDAKEPTKSGTISICPDPDDAPAGPYFEVLNNGLSYIFGPSILNWEYYPDPNNLNLVNPLHPVIAASVQGPRRAEAVPYLIELVKMKPTYFKQEAIQALGYLGPLAEAAIPDLRMEMIVPDDYMPTSDNFMFPSDAIIALAKIGDPEIAPVLVEQVRNGDGSEALTLLNSLDPELSYEIMSEILSQGSDASLVQQQSVVQTLKSLGHQSANMAPALIDLLLQDTSGDTYWIEQAILSLRPINEYAAPEEYTPLFFDSAQKFSSDDNCALLVASFGTDALQFIENEIDNVPEIYSQRFTCALKTLQYYGPELQTIMPTILKHIQDNSGLTGEQLNYYISALGSIGPGAITAVPTLVGKLNTNQVDNAYIPEALTNITGQDFGTDVNAWTVWWNEYVK